MERFAFLLFCVLATAACTRYEPVMGPFDGTIVDAVTGKPIPGAFVGFVWNGMVMPPGIWSRSRDCLHAVLVRADNQGHYTVPKQEINLDTSHWYSFGWVQTAWAPGFLLAEANPADPQGDAVIYSHQPGVSSGEGNERAMRHHVDHVTAQGMRLPLFQSSSVVEAIDRHNRMSLFDYKCGATEVSRIPLAKALYQDSFKRICEVDIPVGSLNFRDAQTVEIEFENFAKFDAGAAIRLENSREQRRKFNHDAGWEPTYISDYKYPLLKPELLPEFCKLVSPTVMHEENAP